MKRSEIEREVGRILKEELNLPFPSADTDLIETGLLDSLALVDLLLHIETTFGIQVQIEDLEIDHLRTANAISEFVAKLTQ